MYVQWVYRIRTGLLPLLRLVFASVLLPLLLAYSTGTIQSSSSGQAARICQHSKPTISRKQFAIMGCLHSKEKTQEDARSHMIGECMPTLSSTAKTSHCRAMHRRIPVQAEKALADTSRHSRLRCAQSFAVQISKSSKMHMLRRMISSSYFLVQERVGKRRSRPR